MSYHTVHIGKLSPTQISKILNSHPVRIKGGSAHSIGLSKEQHKKFSKAHHLGKAVTISFDPFQIHHHQHLREKGTGTDFGHVLGHVAGEAAEAGGTRLVDAIAGTDSSNNQGAYDNSMSEPSTTGSGIRRHRRHKSESPSRGGAVNRLSKAKRWTGFVQNNLGAQQVQDALMNRAASSITYGGNVNRLNKAGRWTGFVQNNLGLQPVQDAIMGRTANGITYGFGLKKRVAKKPKKKAHGGSMYDAGYGPPGW